jgi:porphobilinogen synthase
MNQRQFPQTRMRRIRLKPFARNLCAENQLSINDLIFPVFVMEGQSEAQAIESMPGISRLSIDLLVKEAKECSALGIQALALFPYIEAAHKSEDARYAFDDDGLIPRAVKAIKAACPEIGIIVDVALDPYTSHGQDGLIDENGEILNDKTLEVLVKQALCCAKAGADIVAPSDMMDGRIGVIRQALEKNDYSNVMVLAYAAKYASSFYGPFRDAVGSKASLAKADKLSYQMSSSNADEALHEVALDIQEGADIVMVKPGLPYLDIVTKVKTQFKMPTFAYHVSGEFAMLKAAAQHGWLDERQCVLEALLCFKRAGCDAVLTYYAKEVAGWLAQS